MENKKRFLKFLSGGIIALFGMSVFVSSSGSSPDDLLGRTRGKNMSKKCERIQQKMEVSTREKAQIRYKQLFERYNCEAVLAGTEVVQEVSRKRKRSERNVRNDRKRTRTPRVERTRKKPTYNRSRRVEQKEIAPQKSPFVTTTAQESYMQGPAEGHAIYEFTLNGLIFNISAEKFHFDYELSDGMKISQVSIYKQGESKILAEGSVSSRNGITVKLPEKDEIKQGESETYILQAFVEVKEQKLNQKMTVTLDEIDGNKVFTDTKTVRFKGEEETNSRLKNYINKYGQRDGLKMYRKWEAEKAEEERMKAEAAEREQREREEEEKRQAEEAARQAEEDQSQEEEMSPEEKSCRESMWLTGPDSTKNDRERTSLIRWYLTGHCADYMTEQEKEGLEQMLEELTGSSNPYGPGSAQ